jgi:Flp pilus assembly protein TadD
MSSRHLLYGDAKASATAGDAGRKQRALATAQERYGADPSAVNRMALATALFDLGRFPDAEQHMKGMLENEADNPDILFELGFIFKNQKRTDEALVVWKHLVASSPKHPLARAAENEIWRLDSTYKPSWLAK